MSNAWEQETERRISSLEKEINGYEIKHNDGDVDSNLGFIKENEIQHDRIDREIAELRDLMSVNDKVCIPQIIKQLNELKEKVRVHQEHLVQLDTQFNRLNMASGGEKTDVMNPIEGKVGSPLIISNSKPPETFRCGHCGNKYKPYHDGTGINTGMCPKCFKEWDTVGLEPREDEPKWGDICDKCKYNFGTDESHCNPCIKGNNYKPREVDLLYCKECNVFINDNIKAGFHLVCKKPLYNLVMWEDLEFLYNDTCQSDYPIDVNEYFKKRERIKEEYNL